ncbi:MAG: hypothetical protein ACYDBQ_06490 [Thermoplasmatota archaeon]
MAKVLGTLAVVGCVLSALGTTLVSGVWFTILFPALAIVTSVLLLMDRRALAVLMALILIVVGVLSIPAAVGDLTIKGGTSLNLLGDFGAPLVVGLGLLVALAVVAVSYGDMQPRWTAPAGMAVLAVAFVWILFLGGQRIGGWANLLATLWPALLCLVGAVPAFIVARSPDTRPRAM